MNQPSPEESSQNDVVDRKELEYCWNKRQVAESERDLAINMLQHLAGMPPLQRAVFGRRDIKVFLATYFANSEGATKVEDIIKQLQGNE